MSGLAKWLISIKLQIALVFCFFDMGEVDKAARMIEEMINTRESQELGLGYFDIE